MKRKNKETACLQGFKTCDLKRICVYAHYFKDEKLPFYIGQGNIARAFNMGDRNKSWKNKVGDNFKDVKVLIMNIDISYEESISIEKSLIKKYGRLDNNTGCLTNENDGGSNSQFGPDNYFYDKRFYGSDNSNYGNKYELNPISIPVIQIDVFGNIVKEWSSATEASDKLGFSSSTICACCKGKRAIHHGYQWIFKKDYDERKDYSYNPKGRQRKVFAAFPIGHYGDVNNMILMYGFNDIEKKYGFSTGKISLVINGKRKSHKGHVFADIFNLPKDEKEKYIPYIDVTKI